MKLSIKREELISEGFCTVPGVLNAESLQTLRDASDSVVAAMTDEERERNRSTGSMIVTWRHDAFTELVASPEVEKVLKDLGFNDCKFTSGFVISKPPKSPPLFWHYDWAAWNHPFSYEPFPAQIFLMFYLVDTTRENGCLRVIPRSHIEENPLHEVLRNPHTDELRRANDLTWVEFQERPDDVDVPVKAGDLVMGDSRILHSAHSNDSDKRRTVITLWFHPDFGTYPDPIRGYVANMYGPPHTDWPEPAKSRMEELTPKYEGSTEAIGFSRDRLSREEFFQQLDASAQP